MSPLETPWMARAWKNWHRPWATTHAGWLDTSHAEIAADATQELTLRLHYLSWCEHYALAPSLNDFDDTPWWRLFSLTAVSFEQAARRVGAALMYAATPRSRLLRLAHDDLETMRWALERAHFVPREVAAALQSAKLGESSMQHAAVSLNWCLQASTPALWDRVQRRFAPNEALPSATRWDPGPMVSNWLAAVWSRSVLLAINEDES